MANSADQLPAVAAAGGPGKLAGFEQDYRMAAFGQFDRGVDAGKAAADHAHIGLGLAFEGWAVEAAVAGGVVIGSRWNRAGKHRGYLSTSGWHEPARTGRISGRTSACSRNGSPSA
ncbi:hypothetical protein D3C81_1896040 [compost metagenome]